MSTQEAQRQYQREWKAKRRKAYFQDKFCVICGSTDRLELDHTDPSTKLSHNIWSWSEARRKTELNKCQILCFVCHKDKTKRENVRKIHGTRTMYMNHKCRCEPCVVAASDYRQRQRRSSAAP